MNAYKQAITSWNNTGAFNFLLTNDKQKANIIADERYEGNVAAPLGVTYSTYYLPTKQYSNATVYLNTFHVQNNYYQKNGGKLLNTAQHELGHSIGLEHNSAVASVMDLKVVRQVSNQLILTMLRNSIARFKFLHHHYNL